MAQAAALSAAAKLKIQESQALHRAQVAKAKHDAYELMKSTAAEAAEAKRAYDAENEKKVEDAEGSEEDLKKALETPFNQKALKQVVEERDELKTDAKDNADLKEKWQAAAKRAESAKKAVADGEATNWGLKTASVEAPEEVKPTADESSGIPETKKQPKDNMQDYENMSEKEVQYWLNKPMKFMDVDPQSPSQVMDEMFQAKQKEADEMRTLTSLQKGAESDESGDDKPKVVDGETADPNTTIDVSDTDPKNKADGGERDQETK